MLILALESSSTSSKAMLFDSMRGIIKTETCPFPSQIDNIISQDTDGVYSELLKLAGRISANQKIDAIALGGTWHNAVVCDKAMRPVTRTHSWLDTAAASVASRLRADSEFASYYYKTCGCMVHSTYIPFKLMHMKEQGLNLSNKFIIDQGSYNFLRLTGKKICTASMASGMGLLNIRKLKFEEEALKIAGINESQLGHLGSYRDYGRLTEPAAKEIELPCGTPVLPAFPDGALNQLGANAMQPRIMTLSVGTSAAMRITANAPLVSDCCSTWCYVSAMDTWLTGAATAGACNCIDWVKKQLLKDKYSYHDLEDTALNKEHMPIFLPFIYGERCPGWDDNRGGGYYGINASHGPADFFVSAMEGILFNIKQCYDILKSLTGPPAKIMVSGGISNSPMWLQMLSDILDECIYSTDMGQSSLIGGAYLAATALASDSLAPGNLATDTLTPGSNFNILNRAEESIAPDDFGKSLHRRRYERYLSLYGFC